MIVCFYTLIACLKRKRCVSRDLKSKVRERIQATPHPLRADFVSVHHDQQREQNLWTEMQQIYITHWYPCLMIFQEKSDTVDD